MNSSSSFALFAKVENSSITSLNLNSRYNTLLQGVFHDALALLQDSTCHTLPGALFVFLRGLSSGLSCLAGLVHAGGSHEDLSRLFPSFILLQDFS